MFDDLTCDGILCTESDKLADIDAVSLAAYLEKVSETADWLLPITGIVTVLIGLALGVFIGWTMAGGH